MIFEKGQKSKAEKAPEELQQEIKALPQKYQSFKETSNFRKVEQVILKCCALCFYSRLLKQKINKANIDLLVCCYNQEEMFPSDWGHVCDNFE
jgi:hypothetical protein